MTAPRLVPVFVPAERMPSPDARLFGVVEAGDFGGMHLEAGEVVACRPVSDPSGPVVLEARGFGRPRLGRIEGHALFGDGGESCSPIRWRVVGEIVAVLQGEELGSGGPLFALKPGLRVVSDEGSSPGGRARRAHAWATPQLSLFGGACAA